MPFSYTQVIRMAAHRVKAITGTDPVTLEAAYTTTPLTATQVSNSADFPLSPIKDAIIATVGKIVRAYANVSDHPFRTETQTANIANKGAIPKLDSGGKKIVGVFGAIRDASTGNVLTEQPVQLIRSINTSKLSGHLKDSYFHHKIIGKRLEHTVANAVIDVQVWDEPTERVLINAQGSCSLDDSLFDAVVMGTVSILVIDDSYAAQSSLAANYVDGVLAEIKQGASTFLPAPTMINTQEPRVS